MACTCVKHVRDSVPNCATHTALQKALVSPTPSTKTQINHKEHSPSLGYTYCSVKE
jgi:hypothetical protein